jgi:hypothetical protein
LKESQESFLANSLEVSDEAIVIITFVDESDVLLAPHFLGLVQKDAGVKVFLQEETVIPTPIGILGEVLSTQVKLKELLQGDFEPAVAGVFVEGEVVNVVEVHTDESDDFL